MTDIPTPFDDGQEANEGKRRRGTRKPPRSNEHFMSGPEAIRELDGIMSRNEFYNQINDGRIPHLDRRSRERVRVPRDFIAKLKERAMKKLDEPSDAAKPSLVHRVQSSKKGMARPNCSPYAKFLC